MEEKQALKIELVRQGLTQTKVALMCGIHRNTFSQIATGRLNPTEEEKRKIAKVLQKKICDLFPGE